MGALWHITVTLAGRPAPAEQVRAGLLHLCSADPANLAARFRSDGAELQYWDEGDDLLLVARSAARLWPDARTEAGLPDWRVVGLEVCDTPTLRGRVAATRTLARPGSVELASPVAGGLLG
jgi:hypothetical protein